MTFERTLTMRLSEEDRTVFETAYHLVDRMSEVAERESPFSHWSWVSEITGECITESDIPRLKGILSCLADNGYLVIGD